MFFQKISRGGVPPCDFYFYVLAGEKAKNVVYKVVDSIAYNAKITVKILDGNLSSLEMSIQYEANDTPMIFQVDFDSFGTVKLDLPNAIAV